MRPRFHPRLINGPFDDPGLYIPFLFENRAIIFDLGDTLPLPARDLLKISHAFITHTHVGLIFQKIGVDHDGILVIGQQPASLGYGWMDQVALGSRCPQPDVVAFDIRHPESGLAHDLAHTEGPDPVPRADDVTQAALIAPLEGITTVLFDDIDDFFVVGYVFHGL